MEVRKKKGESSERENGKRREGKYYCCTYAFMGRPIMTVSDWDDLVQVFAFLKCFWGDKIVEYALEKFEKNKLF